MSHCPTVVALLYLRYPLHAAAVQVCLFTLPLPAVISVLTDHVVCNVLYVCWCAYAVRRSMAGMSCLYVLLEDFSGQLCRALSHQIDIKS